MMTWDWSFAQSILPDLGRGAIVTVLATILGSFLSTTLGLLWSILIRADIKYASAITRSLLDFVRGTPLLVQLYFVFFVLPDIGVKLPALTAGVLVLGLHYSAYTAEVYRAGILSVPAGQWESARACNFTRRQTWMHVILPQAIPPMIPALANYVIAMFKETPLLSAIAVAELMTEARGIANYTYRYAEPMTLVGLYFLTISIISASLTHMLEKKLNKRYR